MKKTSSLTVVLLLLAAGGLSAQYNRDNLHLETEKADAQYTFDKLRLYPITANRVFIEAHRSVGTFKPLKAGLADGTINIVERGAGTALASAPAPTPPAASAQVIVQHDNPVRNAAPATNLADTSYQNNDGHVRVREQYLSTNNLGLQIRDVNAGPLVQQQYNQTPFSTGDEVNRLYIENTSDDTVFIMAGEVVKGGKQDRVIAADMVIPPHSEPIDLSVFCVEHGRWTYGEADAADGFTGHASVANTSVRKAAVTAKDQSEVWKQVAVVTQKNGAASETGTLNALEQSETYQKELKAYEARFTGLPASAPSVIGVVAVTGDRVIGCDMFATPDLFRNAYPDLLKSYISEAISSGASVTISKARVDNYIAEILDESKQRENVLQKGQLFEEKGRKMHISTF